MKIASFYTGRHVFTFLNIEVKKDTTHSIFCLRIILFEAVFIEIGGTCAVNEFRNINMCVHEYMVLSYILGQNRFLILELVQRIFGRSHSISTF